MYQIKCIKIDSMLNRMNIAVRPSEKFQTASKLIRRFNAVIIANKLKFCYGVAVPQSAENDCVNP